MNRYERITYEKRGNVAKVTMNRPDVLNAQDYRMLEELEKAFEDADLDPDIRVVVLAGNGRAFSSGHDLLGGLPLDDVRRHRGQEGNQDRMEDAFAREGHIYYQNALKLRNISKPSIAMVHGHCMAGGLVVAAVCDLIIASEDALFSNPVLRMHSAASQILNEVWDLGPRKAKEFLWTGDSIDAQQALALGMVNRVVPREELEVTTFALARRIAIAPPFPVMLLKRSINRAMDMMGQTSSWDYQFIVHLLSYAGSQRREFNDKLDQARRDGTLRDVLKWRDGGYDDHAPGAEKKGSRGGGMSRSPK